MTREAICKTISELKGEAGHLRVLSVYNAQEPLPRGYRMQKSDAWCAATVTAVFLLNGYNGFAECSCPKMIEKAKALGLWQEADDYVPDVGDVIFYDWQDQGWGDNVGVADHVGIVIGISDNNILVREGNYNHSVRDRSIRVNGRYIRGYICPPYGLDSELVQVPEHKEPTSEVKPLEKPQSAPEGHTVVALDTSAYTINKVYTVRVRSSLNVRTGAGLDYPYVGYAHLTPDARRHANSKGALLPGTRVTCLEVISDNHFIWMRIPSGWICARMDGNIYVS